MIAQRHDRSFGSTDFIGRWAELRALHSELSGVHPGRSVVIDVIGEPGVGKTRLLAEFAAQAGAQGISVTHDLGTAQPISAAPPGLVLLDHAERIAPERFLLPALLPANERPPGGKIIVVARRPQQTSPQLLHALAVTGARQITLDGFSGNELRRLGTDQICEVHRARELVETGGNPRDVKILAAMCGGRGNCTGGPLPGPDRRLPAEAAGVLSELAGLSETARLVASAAAVIGGEFDPGLLALVAQLPPEEVLHGIDEILAADLVRLMGYAGQLRLRSPITGWVLYAAAAGGWRFGAHLRALAALRERRQPAHAYAIHLERTALVGDLSSLVRLLEAARLTAGRAPHTAAYWYAAALRLVPADAHASLRGHLEAELATFSTGRPEQPPEVGRAVVGVADGADLAQLSGREYEVAVLVSRGRTNQQIGRSLGVSHKTVETHLSRIFAKLAVCSRAEVASLVGGQVSRGGPAGRATALGGAA